MANCSGSRVANEKWEMANDQWKIVLDLSFRSSKSGSFFIDFIYHFPSFISGLPTRVSNEKWEMANDQWKIALVFSFGSFPLYLPPPPEVLITKNAVALT
jgi:hypothetical protein